MNHIANIAKKLPEYGLDAMLITSPSGERYALGFHGEGLLLVTRDGARYTPTVGISRPLGSRSWERRYL